MPLNLRFRAQATAPRWLSASATPLRPPPAFPTTRRATPSLGLGGQCPRSPLPQKLESLLLQLHGYKRVQRFKKPTAVPIT